ncbi:MAG: hypothetical protein GY729_13705 [Desulfobacteraceae bacterium]|nr:hypothetical protein [Desulfobacteraceae bacterium]
MKKVIPLFAPKNYGKQPCSYFEADEELIALHTNGCGGSGRNEKMVPDKFIGVSVKPACLIHDWQYSFGLTIEDKKTADRIFLNNMVRIIKSKNSFWLLERLRLRFAKTYYNVVKYFGGPYFWAGKKNSVDEFQAVPIVEERKKVA